MTGDSSSGSLWSVVTQPRLLMHASAGRQEGLAEAGVQISPRQDRELAVGTWLLLSADITERAYQEWRTGGITLLRYSALFAALRIIAGLIHTAAGTSAADTANEFLPQVLHGGSVLVDLHNRSRNLRELP
ncbi:hypothetical protein QF037_009809 [Streptomyces canus]|uniref:hypothetical protein n=1 Tax=Streptomyces canus TaxID=58343 RepID=UPI00278696AF|nr:hypothetical protein [Streptomyces canus]MDQ0605464.1 hypothetical protein [Streptomyces canus]